MDFTENVEMDFRIRYIEVGFTACSLINWGFIFYGIVIA